ncbi:hypothetical protein CES86_1428 [Brucella lupini]|uniref:Uncharacterized protein n=1 Tax=Brucella lupini TaxID=255457 RepID=A0A256GXG8_9HYPH|nr:hypothetical protein CES86_1428 [Brucella lupini]
MEEIDQNRSILRFRQQTNQEATTARRVALRMLLGGRA